MRISNAAVAAALVLTYAAGADVLWEAGIEHGADPGTFGLVTHPGAGPDGTDVSMVASNVPIFGANWTLAGGGPEVRLADRFHVSDAPGWVVNSITVFGYVTDADVNSNPFGTFSLNVWDGTPGEGNIVGSTTTHLEPEFTGIWRQTSGNFPNNTDRGIFAITLTFESGLTLDQIGTYWWDVQQTGGQGTAWMPPITINDDSSNPFSPAGSAMVLTNMGGWEQLFDFQNGNPYGLPAIIQGSIIPAPGALAMLGIAGLIGTRRRRRN